VRAVARAVGWVMATHAALRGEMIDWLKTVYPSSRNNRDALR
jgi:hypothetical protein